MSEIIKKAQVGNVDQNADCVIAIEPSENGIDKVAFLFSANNVVVHLNYKLALNVVAKVVIIF